MINYLLNIKIGSFNERLWFLEKKYSRKGINIDFLSLENFSSFMNHIFPNAAEDVLAVKDSLQHAAKGNLVLNNSLRNAEKNNLVVNNSLQHSKESKFIFKFRLSHSADDK